MVSLEDALDRIDTNIVTWRCRSTHCLTWHKKAL